MAYDLDALELQEFDPVCPICRAPWAGIERLIAELRALRAVEKAAQSVIDCYPTTIAHFREHPDVPGATAQRITALAAALDAARRTTR